MSEIPGTMASGISNADYVVTNDQHFNELKEIDFPKVDVINADEFLRKLKKQKN